MTADEIRAVEFPATRHLLGSKQRFEMLREIAAQLAEQNEQIREDRKQRKVWRDEDQAVNKKRDEVFAGLAATQAGMVEGFKPQPPVNVDFPGTVVHLGCVIREPDGAYKIATNQGQLLELAEADFQRIFAPPVPSEAKPS